MKIVPVLLIFLGTCFGFLLNHYIDGAIEMKQEEYRQEGQLAANLSVFQMMKLGHTSAAMSSMKVLVVANIKTYQYYKKNFPNFGKDNAKFQQILEQAYQAVPGAEGDQWPIPGVTTVMPTSSTDQK